MDYETVLELVDEMPREDKLRLADHLKAMLAEQTRVDRSPEQAHHDRVRELLKGMLSEYQLDSDDPARPLTDDAAEKLLDMFHEETAGAEPLSTAVIENREQS